MYTYKKADISDLETIWDYNIAQNPEDDRYLRWKQQFIGDNTSGRAATFVILADNEPVGEGTLLLSPDCRAVRGRTQLCDGQSSANINALRIREEYEGQGHVSRLMEEMERYARSIGLTRLTIGVEAQETRNLAIYLHWGYRELVFWEVEEDALILYYSKNLS